MAKHDIVFLLFNVAPVLQPHRTGYKSSVWIPVWRVLVIREVQMMYAIIEAGGKQLKVEEGQEIYVEKIAAEPNETVTFDKVLFVGGDDVKIGSPYVEGANVTAKVEKHGRQKKITVFKYKPKKNYHRKQGHRQPYTKLVVDKINA